MISVDNLKFGPDGLIPAVVVDHYTKEVLTLAYMNRESLDVTMKKGLTCFTVGPDRSSGSKAKAAAISSTSWTSRRTATATRLLWKWSRTAPPVTRVRKAVFTIRSGSPTPSNSFRTRDCTSSSRAERLRRKKGPTQPICLKRA